MFLISCRNGICLKEAICGEEVTICRAVLGQTEESGHRNFIELPITPSVAFRDRYYRDIAVTYRKMALPNAG